MELLYFILFSSLLLCHAAAAPATSAKVNKVRSVDWFKSGQDHLKEALKRKIQTGVAKNVILFVGDGMGVPTVTAARVLKAQQEKISLHDSHLSWDKFPHLSLSKTYNVDLITPDSSGTANALLTGYKTNAAMVGVNNNVIRSNCALVKGNEIESIFHRGNRDGKWTGIVTTTRVTHATPSAAYASTPERQWECNDGRVPSACKDIARQLVEDNHFIRVVLGGGRAMFTSRNESDPEYPEMSGKRIDGRNLIKEWEAIQKGKSGVASSAVHYVANKTDFDNLDEKNVDYLLGLFQPYHMQYEIDREDPAEERWGEPSLAEMTEKAIKVLSKNKDGYILLVEGGRIDHGHHGNKAQKALTDTLALSDAVAKAASMTDEKDTLILVTADHSHVFSLSGYPAMTSDILGLTMGVKKGTLDETVPMLGRDGLPMLPLSYANGPGYAYHRANGTDDVGFRKNLTSDAMSGLTRDKNYRQDAGIPLKSESHGGEDVAVFSRGPMSHLMNGVHEQSYIAHVMMYASCVGPNKEHCATTGSGATLRQQWASFATMFTTTLLIAMRNLA